MANMRSTPSVISLGDAEACDRDIVGNKAATLAYLLARQYPVPDGVVVGTHPADDDDEVVALVVNALGRNGISPPWIVRSSSTVEDGTGAAFPGVFRTMLGVSDEAALALAIQAVRDSRASELVRRYISARDIRVGEVNMAVLIQSQLSPRAAGVAFSRDPVNGEDHVGIDANYGLGETVVDGSVSPDYFVVDRSSKITTRVIGSKRESVLYAAGGLARQAVSDAARKAPAISDDDAVCIAKLAWQVERDLGAPQDIEWALVDHSLYLLQARPITTGGPIT